MPEGYVLKTGREVAAQYPGEPAEPLGEDGVPLVRHRRGALLARCECLFDLTNLRPGHVADLGGEVLDGGARGRDGPEQLGVAVAGDHLRGGHRLETERVAHEVLDRWVDVRVRPDGAGELANRDGGASSPEPLAVPLGCERKQGHLGAEGRGLRVHAVGAADDGHVDELDGTTLEHRDELARCLNEQVRSLGELPAQCRVDDV